MKFPNFYNIFCLLSDSLFNAFSKIEREKLLPSFYELKSRFELIQNEENDSLVYSTLLQFFTKYISTLDFQIIIDDEKVINSDREVLNNKNLDILDKSSVVMKELYKLFESTGLIVYLSRDVKYGCIPKRDTMAIDENDYLVIDKEDEYKLDNFEPFMEEHELLGKKTERQEEGTDLEIESFKLNYRKRSMENFRYSIYDDSPVRYRIENII
jgi:hypothetical protein